MSEMNQLISEFPNNFLEAKQIASEASFQTPKNEIHNISSVAIQRLNILLYTPLGTLVSSVWDESYST